MAFVWKIDPLPDFLLDHTLTGVNDAERLGVVTNRWIQLVGSLWGWQGGASFALRYLAASGKIEVYFVAQPHTKELAPILKDGLTVLLRYHRLGTGEPCAPAEARHCLAIDSVPEPAIIEVRQQLIPDLWNLASPRTAGNVVVLPWWGPAGPYLLPMECLASLPGLNSLTVYLEPVARDSEALTWLAAMANEASDQADRTITPLREGAKGTSRRRDHDAELAARLYAANLRRLQVSPYLVAAHCAAAGGRWMVARRLVDALSALIYEPRAASGGPHAEELPSGLEVYYPESITHPSYRGMLAQYQGIRFPSDSGREVVDRLPYLADARGAATFFRLPVSVRGGVPGVRVRQLMPGFHIGVATSGPEVGVIDLGIDESGQRAVVPLGDLTKHTLITGFTGSGKTVTVLRILHEAWTKHRKPFLVVESAKQEYRGLLKAPAFRDDLLVLTAGNENCSPVRINPFELLPGVRVEAHIGRLQTCLEAAIPPVGPSTSIIAAALDRVYRDCGWELTDVMPRDGRALRKFPDMSQFVEAARTAIEARGYAGDIRSNMLAAIPGRFEPLLLGSKGLMLDTQRSDPPMAELFSRPTILELNDLNLGDKALIVMFVLVFLREFRERERGKPGELLHLTVVEEAHNVLEKVGSEGGGEGAAADARYKAVEAFCQLLTEVRALGEGLIIADQSPEKLARDALRNTNLQVAHQLRDSVDREAIARAMIMEDEQRDYLGKLHPGRAAFFRTGLEKATFIQIEDALGPDFDPRLDDEGVRALLERRIPGFRERRRLRLPMEGCTACTSQCAYRDAMYVESLSRESMQSTNAWLAAFNRKDGADIMELWRRAALNSKMALSRAGCSPASADAAWCHLLHVWERYARPRRDDGKPLAAASYRDFTSAFRGLDGGPGPVS